MDSEKRSLYLSARVHKRQNDISKTHSSRTLHFQNSPVYTETDRSSIPGQCSQSLLLDSFQSETSTLDSSDYGSAAQYRALGVTGVKIKVIMVINAALATVALSILMLKRHETTSVSKLVLKMDRPNPNAENSGISGIVQSSEDFRSIDKLVHLSVCQSSLPDGGASWHGVKYNWIFTSVEENKVWTIISTVCELTWRAPRYGAYTVKVTMVTMRSEIDKESAVIVGESDLTTIRVKSLWVVSMGDSFASGQGSPDRRAEWHGIVPARWFHPGCYQSKKSWPWMVAQELYMNQDSSDSKVQHVDKSAVMFTHLACAGASIYDGVMNVTSGRFARMTGDDVPVQLSQVERLRRIVDDVGRKPDIILLSVGANDIDFSSIIVALLAGHARPAIRKKINSNRVAHLRENLKILKEELEGLVDNDGHIFQPLYYDLTGGAAYMCNKFSRRARVEDWVALRDDALPVLNNIILESVQDSNGTAAASWHVVQDVRQAFHAVKNKTKSERRLETLSVDFSGHGMCSVAAPYIVSPQESIRNQGDIYGAFHPNLKGQMIVSDLVLRAVLKILESRGT